MPTKYWFKEWFDSEDYHKLYNHRNQEEAETFIQNLNNHVNQPGMRVLDMACGKGRHAQTFADLGHTTVGLIYQKIALNTQGKEVMTELSSMYMTCAPRFLLVSLI